MTKYPDITVKLVGTDGNSFAIISKVKKALKQNEVSKEEIDLFVKEATSGDWNNVLFVCMKWVNVN
jgi:hypothetical protein